MDLSRRRFLKAGIAAGALAGGVASWKYAPGILSARNRDNRPNILMVTMDTTRYDRMGFNGYHRDTTPNLDKIAEQGVIFHKNYSQAPVTSLSIPSFLTSKYPKDLELSFFFQEFSSNALRAAEIFKSLGYNTGAATSTSFLNKRFIGEGFDYFSSPTYSSENLKKKIEELMGSRDLDKIKALFAIFFSSLGIRNGEETSDALIDIFKRFNANQPNFLWIHYFDAHAPYASPEEFRLRFAKDRIVSVGRKYIYSIGNGRYNSLLISDDEAAFLSDEYDGQISYADHHIGRLLENLRKLGYHNPNRDLVIVNADHGELLGEHGYFGFHHSAYREVIHTPLMMSGAGLPKGRNLECLTANLDILPTLLEIVKEASGGKSPNFRFDGKSLVGVINGDSSQIRDYVLSDLSNFEGSAVTNGRFLYIQRLSPGNLEEFKSLVEGFSPQGVLNFDRDIYREQFMFSWPEINTEGLDRETLFTRLKILDPMSIKTNIPLVFEFPYLGNSKNAMDLWSNVLGEDKWNLSATNERYKWAVQILYRYDKGNERVVFDSDDYGSLEFRFNPTPKFNELYDLDSDPREQVNLVGVPEFQTVRNKMQSLLQEYNDDLFVQKTGYTPEVLDESQKEQLKALGYL